MGEISLLPSLFPSWSVGVDGGEIGVRGNRRGRGGGVNGKNNYVGALSQARQRSTQQHILFVAQNFSGAAPEPKFQG
jgi:hypothetical protein